jgi:hypothetical protein
MAVKGRSEDTKTPLCRFAFTKGLFEVQTTESGKKQWNCTLLFPKDTSLEALEKAALAAAEQAWPGKAVGYLKDGTIKSPFLDGDGKQGRSKKTDETHAGFAGTRFIRVQSGEDSGRSSSTRSSCRRRRRSSTAAPTATPSSTPSRGTTPSRARASRSASAWLRS